jgi:predicted esterase
MSERHIRVSRTARIHLVGSPGPHVRDVWFACHGYGQLAAEFASQLGAAAAEERLIVAPEALSRFYLGSLERDASDRRVGATWMTREDRDAEIADYVAYLDTVYRAIMTELPASGVRVHVLGFSQGVATVMRWIALGTAQVDALTLWAGGLAHDVDLDEHAPRFARITVTLVAGEHDRLVTDAVLATAHDRLRAAGIAHEVVRFAGGHRLDDAVLRRLAAAR